MILASFLLFFIVMRIVLGRSDFNIKRKFILLLSLLVIIGGMLFGRYGAQWGLPWWIYYPIPMLMNVVLPPVVLKMKFKKTLYYLALSFLSAPLIHAFFSFFFGWSEYMPFWNIPPVSTLF